MVPVYGGETFKRISAFPSRYHMPRALFLTRLYLLGTTVKVYPFSSDSPNPQMWNSRVFWREYLKFWGSIYRIKAAWVASSTRHLLR